ncbi:MAG: tetrahydrofolate dehydrogenase/cyclohydrolase catalytic domain-containing protein [Bacteroidota bacterium]
MTETAHILDGKQMAADIRAELRKKVEAMKAAGKRAPHLAAIQVGSHGPSEVYVGHKIKACEEVGFTSSKLSYNLTISEAELLQEIDKVNDNPEIDGLIVQLPLPEHIKADNLINRIQPEKDVDGFHPLNFGRMVQSLPTHVPATPLGIMEMIKRAGISVVGKHCVVVGRSRIVGSPISILMSRRRFGYPGGATTTLTHRFTPDLEHHTRQADILITAVGKPGLITGDMVKEGVVVIDVGIERVKDPSKKSGFALKGDVDFETVAPKASMITPVPGGVGPMTIAGLLKNTYHAALGDIYTREYYYD